MSENSQSSEDLIKEVILVYLDDVATHKELETLMEFADRAACVIRGSIAKAKYSGQGDMTYATAIESGAKYLQKTVQLLTTYGLEDAKAELLFEMAFEKALARYGDPYLPSMEDTLMLQMPMPEDDMLDDDD